MTSVKVHDKIVKEIVVELDHDDPLEASCMWAVFTIEPEAMSLTIRSDAGNLHYHWQNIGDNSVAGFYKFLSRLDKAYLLSKLSNQTCFNFDKTVKSLVALTEPIDADYAAFIKAMEPCNSAYDFAEQLLKYPNAHSDDLECIQNDYPSGHQAVVDIFIKYVQPELARVKTA